MIISALSDASSTSANILAGSMGMVNVLLLLVLLGLKEITSASTNQRLQRMSQALNIAIYPLLVAFALIVVLKIIEILS